MLYLLLLLRTEEVVGWLQTRMKMHKEQDTRVYSYSIQPPYARAYAKKNAAKQHDIVAVAFLPHSLQAATFAIFCEPR